MSFKANNIFAVFFKYSVFVGLLSLISAVVLALLPISWFKDYPLDPKSYKVNFPTKLENWNNILNTKSELLLKGEAIGPESLAERDGFIYTGLLDGRLVEINKKTLNIRDVTTFRVGSDSGKPSECGRVLGVRFHRDGYLYALDYYNGLFRVNVSTGRKQLLSTKVEHKMGFDDLEFDPKLNVVYISMMSTKWRLDRVVQSFLDYDNSGYIFAYNLDTNTSLKLRTGLKMPNGLQLSEDKKQLLMAESQAYRISKTSIESIHKAIKENRLLNKTEVQTFADLPGEPDNVRLDPSGDILVSLYLIRKNGKTLADCLSEWPFVRKIIGRNLYLFGTAIDFVNSRVFCSKFLKDIVTELYSGEFLVRFVPKNGGIIKLDSKNGKIKQILGSEQFTGVTQALVDSEGDLYFGSFQSPFLGRVKRGDY